MNKVKRILGAVIAGGQSRRFGSDKAMARLDGRVLIDHVIDRVSPQVETIVVVGRSLPGHECLPDRPMPGLGPLGGISAALHLAAARGYDAILSVGCDTPRLPDDLVESLAPAMPSYIDGNYLIGCWPAALTETLDRHLASTADRSIRTWARFCAARAVPVPGAIANVNRAQDLELLQRVEAVP